MIIVRLMTMMVLHKRKKDTPFEEVLPEMLGKIADALADGIECRISPMSIIVAIKPLLSSFSAAI
jgi:hypothetical protein